MPAVCSGYLQDLLLLLLPPGSCLIGQRLSRSCLLLLLDSSLGALQRCPLLLRAGHLHSSNLSRSAACLPCCCHQLLVPAAAEW